jgi:hypothetical protein
VRAVDAAGNQSLPSTNVSATTLSVATGDTTGVLSGVAYDQSGARLKHATVTTTLPTGGVETNTTTPNGVWKLTSLPAGTYTVTISFAGLQSQSFTITVVLQHTLLANTTL